MWQLKTVLVFAKISTLRYFRDPLALFFTIAFPLIFLFVFGSISSKSGNDVSFKVALINESQTSYAKQFVKDLSKLDVIKVDSNVTDLTTAQQKMARGELDATLIVPNKFGAVTSGTYPSGKLEVRYTQNNQQAAETLSTIIDSSFDRLNSQFVSTDRPFTVFTKEINQRSLSSFDYTFSGLLGFAIIGLGIFGPMNVFPELKKQGVLRRISTTPLRVWQYFLANALTQAGVGLVTTAIMFTVATIVFDLHVVGNYLELALFVVYGIIMILGIGLALGGWARNERQAAPLGNIVVFPMMFLSGTFFPRYAMPDWLQTASGLLPLTPVIDGIRLIATEGQHLTQIGPQLGLMTLWLFVIYGIAFRVFRWE